MTHKVRFTKVKNSHNRLRDNVIEGTCKKFPRVGECFSMRSVPKDPAAVCRYVNTNVVTKVDGEVKIGRYIFETASGSKYMVQRLP